jgi:hypothetical protein
MSEITRIGADLAKNVIQVHGVDAVGKRPWSPWPTRMRAFCGRCLCGARRLMHATSA